MNLSGRTTNPGELNTQISVYERTTTTGAGGFQVRSAGDKLCDCWARWENVHGAEVWAAATVEAQKAATVLIRYDASIDETCLILKGSKTYEIVSMDNLRERNEYIELKVRLMVEG
jgi:SPP1 family predicted phage head-tail adaptor